MTTPTTTVIQFEFYYDNKPLLMLILLFRPITCCLFIYLFVTLNLMSFFLYEFIVIYIRNAIVKCMHTLPDIFSCVCTTLL